MQLHLYGTDGEINITPLDLSDVAASKRTALELVANPSESGIYRVQFVDADYDRVCWDSYFSSELPVGTLVFAGVA